MGRANRLLAMIMALFLLTFPRADALAEVIGDSPADLCILSSQDALSASVAIAATDWNCQPRKDDARTEHVWVRISPASVPHDEPVLVGDAMAMDGLLLARRGANGDIRTQEVDAREIAKNWTSGTRFALPVSQLGEDGPLYVRVDGALGPEIALTLKSVPASFESQSSRGSLVLLGLVLGILLLTSVISGFMAVALKQRFAALHFAFSLLLCVYVATSGSLVFLVLPEMSLWTRSVVAYAAIAWSIALLAPFVLSFFEEDTISPLMRRLAIATALLALAAGFYLPLGELLGINLRTAYNLSFLPGAVVTVAIAVSALLKGSQAARLFLMAWSIPFLFATERLLRNIGLYSLPPIADFGFYLALAVQGTVLTLAVGWRINTLRLERDAALALRHSLEREARFDALTGLHNRRDYDAREWAEGDMLALIDIDRFKTINDTYGHETGDTVLITLGRYFADEVRDGRLQGAWRLGGEEFAIVVRERNVGTAAITLDRMRRRIPYFIDNEVAGLDHPVTASVGLAPLGKGGAAECYRNADRLLYDAKRSGRDRLCFADDAGTVQESNDNQLNLSRKVE